MSQHQQSQKNQKNLKRLPITSEDKESMELVSGQHILLKNTFDQSGSAIGNLMDQAVQNALEYLTRRKLGQKLGLYEENNLYKALLELQKTLSIPNFPHRIECYDISHLQGTYVYGSMVVFVEGKPAKKLYRLFKTKQQNNDFENLAEVIQRRLERYLKHSVDETNLWQIPDLIVIDGGRGQLSSVMAVIETYRAKPEYSKALQNLILCSLAKKEELVFVPGSEVPIIFSGLPRFLLERLRDETHRFGIKNNRNARTKEASKSVLEDIPGVGKITAQKLLVEFGSVENLITQLWDNYTYVVEQAGEATALVLSKHFGVKK
jgi:excinuclease ABC subunit C